MIDLGSEAGVIEKSGTWYSYKEEKIGQGKENAKQFLSERKDLASAIYRSIMEESGVVKEKMMEGKMEGKEEEKTISEDSIKDPQ